MNDYRYEADEKRRHAERIDKVLDNEHADLLIVPHAFNITAAQDALFCEAARYASENLAAFVRVAVLRRVAHVLKARKRLPDTDEDHQE